MDDALLLSRTFGERRMALRRRTPAGAGRAVSFVRVGTLDAPDAMPPDVHIFTASKQPWVVLPPGTPAVPEYYDRKQLWPAESLARRQALLARQDTAAKGG